MVSIESNSVLLGIKLGGGDHRVGGDPLRGGSLDDRLIASVIAFVSVRRADQPADVEHPYGHEKLESLGSGSGIAVLGFSAVANVFVWPGGR